MRTNLKFSNAARTHEGGLSTATLTHAQQLHRSVMACLLFEDSFYESGEDAATRIKKLVRECSFEDVAEIAIEAREAMKLRHVPLLLVRELLRYHTGRKVGDLIESVIQRPDEMAELLALYWKDGKNQPLTSQLKIGLARAFGKFNEYQLAKWSKDNSDIKLRDVLFLSHARPRVRAGDNLFTKKQRKELIQGDVIYARPNGLSNDEMLYGKVAHNMLDTPDTWEVELSGGADKKATFERLMTEKKLGALALLRNLRGMLEAKVDEDIIRQALADMNAERVLPFRFISAAKYAPRLEDALEGAMFKCLAAAPKLAGKTALLVDHSGSMENKISSKSDISRFDAAAALAMILRETSDRCRVFTFSEDCIEIAPRRGFAMLQAMREVINPVSTKLGKAVRHIYDVFPECERIIVITDEQSADRPPSPHGTGYIINVAAYDNGIGYGDWITINGWSESILDYIKANERQI